MEATSILADLNTTYEPRHGLVFYELKNRRDSNGSVSHSGYVESFQIDPESGRPIDAHPLSQHEAMVLSKTLYDDNVKTSFLRPSGLIPAHVLHIDPSAELGSVTWYTPMQQRKLLFRDDLGVPSTLAYVPPLVWKATRKGMFIYALPAPRKPTLRTKLCNAPFFNIYSHGHVCMGSVDIDIPPQATLETFIQCWEGYFFNSYFSHAIAGIQTSRINTLELWKTLMETGEKFPLGQLIPANLTLNDLIQS